MLCAGFSQEGDVEVQAGETITVSQTMPTLDPMKVRVTDASINESVKGKFERHAWGIHLSKCNYRLPEPRKIVEHTPPFRDGPDVDVREWLAATGLKVETPRWIPIVLKWRKAERTDTNPISYTLDISNSSVPV